jgi:pimeloyl-ACP methyl ester carboxylesterase
MRFIVTWLPDTDHLRFMSVVAWFDPRLSRGELRAACLRLGEFISRVEADPDSWAERPLWPTGYCELLWDTRHREGHNYTYRPEPRGPEERFGLIIALHGHGGNNRMWLEAWKEFADEFRFAIICPTFGYGNWEQPEGVLVVERSLSAAKQTWYRKIDPERVFLAGISQGGCGVGRAGLELAGCFAGLVFISPTLEPDLLGSAAFQDGWRNRPVLVVSGGKDRHVKLRTVMAGVESMRANGVIVTVHEDPDAGHLLFFAKHGEVLQAIGRWIDHPRGVAL